MLAYVKAVRGVRIGARGVGLLDRWDRVAQRNGMGCWSRSLLAVYDLPDLVDLDVPWWTFQAVDKVEAFLDSRPDARVFEWGSGASSVWLAKRASSVIAIEHEAVWAARVRELAAGYAEVRLVAPGRAVPGEPAVLSTKTGLAGLDFTDYVAAIDNADGPFDLVVIHGRARQACLAAAVRHLSPGGVIVFDNVDRIRYRDAITAMGSALSVTWTRGLTLCLPYPSATALVSVSSREQGSSLGA